MADCWVVKREDGKYLSGSHGFLDGRHNAFRFVESIGRYSSPREWAASCARYWNAQQGVLKARVVKLVRKATCRDTDSAPTKEEP